MLKVMTLLGIDGRIQINAGTSWLEQRIDFVMSYLTTNGSGQ